MNQSMNEKTILITGATSGIGLVAAQELARLGARVIIVSRSAEKCARVVAQIKNETANEQMEFIAADLSTKQGVEYVANEFIKRHSKLDVLLNNAGAIFLSRQVSADGIEMTLALNHLNYFYLTQLLLEVLKGSQPARVINVSSGAHIGAKIYLEDIQLKQGYAPMKAYSQSKLANILFTYELARKLAGTNVTSNALHPGFVNTGFAKNNGSLAQFAMFLMSPFQKKVDKGAQTSIYLASSPDVENISGKYFVDCKSVESDPISYDIDLAQRLWQLSLDMLA
jgi:NAD(P)-dependent dehydrogenase (short-subunit alcohol dehydrogenase family)